MDNIPKIVGDGWELFIKDGFIGWEFSGLEYRILDMVNAEFPPERIVDEYDERHVVVWGTKFGPLYEDTLDFLHKWGVKCKGVDIPEMDGESGPIGGNPDN
jgi:hypothetical protein